MANVKSRSLGAALLSSGAGASIAPPFAANVFKKRRVKVAPMGGFDIVAAILWVSPLARG
jgi:hypothetical protein